MSIPFCVKFLNFFLGGVVLETMVEKVRRLAAERNVSIHQLEKDLGFGNGFLNPKKTKDIYASRLIAILNYLEISVEEFFDSGEKATQRLETALVILKNRYPEKYDLFIAPTSKYDSLDAHGKHTVNVVLDAEYSRCNEVVETTVIDLGTIRHYLSRPACGVNGMVEGEDYEDIPRTEDMPKNADFCLTVSGDSMEPYISDGDMVFVDETAQLQPLDVGVFSVDGATYVKQFAPGYSGEMYLLSANPKREDANITIPAESSQTVQYFGKVILNKKLPEPVYT